MAVIRLMLVIVAIWLIYRFINRTVFTSTKKNEPYKPEKMVRCQFCEVYITKSDAYSHNEKFYCSYEHYRKMTTYEKNDPGT
jgi:hypothetical protein